MNHPGLDPTHPLGVRGEGGDNLSLLWSWTLGSYSQRPTDWSSRRGWKQKGSRGTGLRDSSEGVTGHSHQVFLHPGPPSGKPGGNQETKNDFLAPPSPRLGQVSSPFAPPDCAYLVGTLITLYFLICLIESRGSLFTPLSA